MKNLIERQDVVINVSPAVCLVFAKIISNNIDGLLQNMIELIGLTESGSDEIINIVQELHTKSHEICFKE
jgi:hypothetical protein